MRIAAILIVAFHAFLSIASLTVRQKRRTWARENVVFLPFFLAGVGIVCGTIMSIPTMVCAMDGEWMFAFFGVVVVVCDSMTAAYLSVPIRHKKRMKKGILTKNPEFLGFFETVKKPVIAK